MLYEKKSDKRSYDMFVNFSHGHQSLSYASGVIQLKIENIAEVHSR